MSLLAELCFKFQTQPEVLATEALALLLNEEALGNALSRFLSYQLQIVPGIPANLKFETQRSSDDAGRPDLVAETPDGHLCVIIEVKFWAALTEKQPTGYLELLLPMQSSPRLLIFVAPAIRHEILWRELTRRVVDSGHAIERQHRAESGFPVALVDSVFMILLSWQSILDVMSQTAKAVGNIRAADIEQLRDLASRMNDDAFLPLREEELSSQVALRIYQYNEILEEVANVLQKDGLCRVKGMGASVGYYGRFVSVCGFSLFLEVSYWHWSQWALTPFWLIYDDKRKEQWPALDLALVSLTREAPPRLMRVDGYPPMMPLYIPAGVERHEVMAALVRQVHDIAQVLAVSPCTVREPVATKDGVPTGADGSAQSAPEGTLPLAAATSSAIDSPF